ncbi:MAG: cobalamin-dependent protein [Chitinivibrionales bacterium]|nr:cobalamin-dependent protein [Chitinivibrionales bacterium]
MLDPKEKMNIRAILSDLHAYRPRRSGWVWRTRDESQQGLFRYKQVSSPLAKGICLTGADHYFKGADPQPDCIITTEIASGRFEDDIRRMRMAAWHGADHIMVIRTLGQSHFDGLLEGTPEGIGGVPITRKQIRASRKALDMIEDEVGRPINFHSYVSGVAGPEIAVLFAEEGVNGAHQDPQYNVLYRNINMIRSFVDAAESKFIMSSHGMLQIDGAHNANATAREAWNVVPELLVQHAINCCYSVKVGMPRESIALSTVPPVAPPAPKLWLDLPYAVALRDLFKGYRFRAQMNTRYATADEDQTNGIHFLDMLISRLTSADIQSTITADEARNVPWHYNNIKAVAAAKQILVGMDGLNEMVKLDRQGELGRRVREIKERAVLFLEEILENGGYFNAVEKGFFVDSGLYPDRNSDGITRTMDSGIGVNSIVKRFDSYYAPVCCHFGHNHLPSKAGGKPCEPIGGCTLCKPEKIVYIDELDPDDNVDKRLAAAEKKGDMIFPEVEWSKDGIVLVKLFFPQPEPVAKAAALELGGRMGLTEVQVVNSLVIHPSEGTFVELRGVVTVGIDRATLVLPKPSILLPDDEITSFVKKNGLKVVAGTLGSDEHSAGLREIIDIKHGGLEKFGFTCINLGTSVDPGKLIDAAVEFGARIILASTIIHHAEVHRINLSRLGQLCIEKGLRQKFVLIGGGPHVTGELAHQCQLDAGFGRGTKGVDVANCIVRFLRGKSTDGLQG